MTIFRSKDATQRYSVEVGLSGNCHHIIKPSSMRSLPSSNKNNPSSSNKENVPKIPHLALDYVSILWNEISSICFQVVILKYICLFIVTLDIICDIMKT